MILDRVAAKVPPGAVVSSSTLSRAHKYLIRTLLTETAGEAWESYRAKMAGRFQQEMDAALGASGVDTDQDGAVEENEGYFAGIEMMRA
jgi:hypothetical protein